MCDDHVPTLFDHFRNMYYCFTHSIKLVRHTLMFIVFYQRVTTDSNYS
jgi:hypothetical protein